MLTNLKYENMIYVYTNIHTHIHTYTQTNTQNEFTLLGLASKKQIMPFAKKKYLNSQKIDTHTCSVMVDVHQFHENSKVLQETTHWKYSSLQK